ncbi:ArnT family glycosyltransferase [Schlesneria sp. DSM 10557]|uniref:ArnT family glycosyltransferase n=1 Tax=Schlesneria sp. DSM 10557 TaxID=3044399 RepID=UPI00359F5854
MDDAQVEDFGDTRVSLRSIAIVLGIYLVLAAVLPAADDEVYYWTWSKELQWSYYDHPPMTAVLIYLSTAVFGDSVFGFRVPACVASAVVVYVIGRLTRCRLLMLGVLFSPLFTIGAVMMTPDSPLILFWALYLWWLVELQQRLAPEAGAEGSVPKPVKITWGWWTLGGIILGCGVLSKYTMGLIVPATFVSLLLSRRRLTDWISGYVYHGVVSAVVASPILIYNIQQGFEPLLFQWKHAAQTTPNALRSMVEFIGVQILLFGTLPFYLFPWVIKRFLTLCQNPRLRACSCLYALPLAFFVYKSTQTRLEGNWALVCFISFWPLAAVWYDSVRASKFWHWSTASAFLPPAIAVVVIFIHLVSPLSIVPVKLDRIHRQFAVDDATAEVARIIQERGEKIPVFADSYQMTSWLRFHGLPAQQVDGATRPSHFTRPPRRLTNVDRAYVVTNLPLSPILTEGFGLPEVVASVPMQIRGVTEGTLNIRLYQKPNRNPVGQPEVP